MNLRVSKMARLVILEIVFVWGAIAAPAQIVTNNFNFAPNQTIPDGNASGLALSTNLTGIFGSIISIGVSLDVSGGYNGDLYAYLRGPDGEFTLLLNRIGVTSGNAFGYSNTGLDITFDDSMDYPNIHFYQSDDYNLNSSGQLTGTWSSDGRNIDPLSDPSDFANTLPTSSLNSFDGENPNGTWTLFLADLSNGGQSTILNWDLEIQTVPEPSARNLFPTLLIFFIIERVLGHFLRPIRIHLLLITKT